MNNSIDNLLQYYSSTERYQAKQNQIPNDAIAFVEDEGVIYTHGHKFGGSADIENGSVTTSKIAQKAVTSSKLADNIQIESLQAENITIQNDDEEIILISGGTEPITSKYGFKKEGKTNADVLLAGGGTKPLSEIGGGGVEQIQSDWNQTNENAKDYIKNKPTIPQVPEIDYEPTPNSDNLVTSGGVYNAINSVESIESGSVTDTSTYERTTYSGVAYYWCTDKVFELNTGDSVIVTPRHVLASQTVWASDPIALIPVEMGSYKYTAAADNMRITVGFTSADEFDYVVTRKNSILDYVSNTTISCVERQTLDFEEQAIARQNIGISDADDHLDATSVNSIQNKVVTEAINQTEEIIEQTKTATNYSFANERSERVEGDNQIQRTLDEEITVRTEEIGDINKEIETIQTGLSAVYTKSEVNNLVGDNPKSEIVIVQSENALDEIPIEERSGKIFKVPGTNNSSYKEIGWSGEEWVTLSVNNYGLDNEPVYNSENSVTSGGLYDKFSEFMRNEREYNFKFALEDGEGNAIIGLDSKDIFRFFVTMMAEKLSVGEINDVVTINNVKAMSEDSGLSNTNFIATDEDDNALYGILGDEFKSFLKFVTTEASINSLDDVRSINGLDIETRDVHGYDFAIVDKYDNIIFNSSDYYSSPINTSAVVNSTKSDVYVRNVDKEDYLVAAAKSISPRNNTNLQLLVVTDTHTNTKSADNWVDAGRDFNSVNALIHLGDVLTPNTPQQVASINRTLKRSKIPAFFVIGNHDAGEGCKNIGWALDDSELYDIFIKPSVDNNFFKEGEYTENKCYWYHDFEKYGVRLIGLYCYDDGNALNDSKWRTITYDSSYPYVKAGNYNSGDKVNVRGYTKHSFEAKNSITLRSYPQWRGYSYMQETDDYPGYKALRGMTWYSQEQLTWLCNLLVDAATKGYVCVIASHHIFSVNSYLDKNCRFTNYKRDHIADYNYFTRFTNDNKDIIADIVDAYRRKTSISKSMVPVSSTGQNYDKQNGVYNYDDASSIPSFTFNYDFSNVSTPSKVTFMCGHEHDDAIIRHNTYDDQMSVMFRSGVVSNGANSDLYRNTNDARTMDILTAYTIAKDSGKICLVRIGADTTDKIDENNNTLVNKTCEFINY